MYFEDKQAWKRWLFISNATWSVFNVKSHALIHGAVATSPCVLFSYWPLDTTRFPFRLLHTSTSFSISFVYYTQDFLKKVLFQIKWPIIFPLMLSIIKDFLSLLSIVLFNCSSLLIIRRTSSFVCLSAHLTFSILLQHRVSNANLSVFFGLISMFRNHIVFCFRYPFW